MPKMHIERSINIDAPADKIYKVVSDFTDWRPWSPWLLMEPEAKVTVADDAKSYTWDGHRVGSGNMKITEEKENSYIDYDLNFLKPWKSSSRTNFQLAQEGNSTKVTWKMDSGLPFFMFWMKKMMEAYVGADYERGLDMLKAYVEKGEVPSKLEFTGETNFPGCKWVGIKTLCSIDDTSKQMPIDFGKIWELAEQDKENIAGEAFSIYHKWDLVKNIVSYTAAIQVKEVPKDLDENFISGEIPPTRAYVLRHVGRYQHLGNAWGTLYSMHRNKELKVKRKVHPFEVYRNDPSKTPENELITDIFFPLK